MLSQALEARIAALIDDLLLYGGVEPAFLATVLLIALESSREGTAAALARRVWGAYHQPGAEELVEPSSSG